MKRNKKVATLMIAVSMLFQTTGIVAMAEDTGTYIEEEKSPKGTIELGENTLNYGFGTSNSLENSDQNSSSAELSKPNVYVKTKDRQVINHIWGTLNSSSNFLLGFMKEDSSTDYRIFSSAGVGGKIYSTKDENGKVEKIKGVVEKEIPNYGKVEFTTILSPSQDHGVLHETMIKNIGDSKLKFVYMKSIDTDLNGNDNVPVKMLGNNQGLYIENGEYRLNYAFDTANKPDNFRNWYNGGYRNPVSDTFEDRMYVPFFPANDLSAQGDESRNYQPDDTVVGRGDTGIWMKWKPVEIAPGESANFDYEVKLFQRIETLVDAYNLTKSADAKMDKINDSRDTIQVKVQVNILEKYRALFKNGKISINLNMLDTNADVRGDNIKLGDTVLLMDKTGVVKKEFSTADVYDVANKTIHLNYDNATVQEGEVEIQFTILGNAKEDNQYVEDTRYLDIRAEYDIDFTDQITKKSNNKLKLKINPLKLLTPLIEPPTLKVSDKSIMPGEPLVLSSLIEEAVGVDGVDLRDEVVVEDEGGFDRNKPSEYQIIYKLQDKTGIIVRKKAKVTVMKPLVIALPQQPKGEPVDEETTKEKDSEVKPQTPAITEIVAPITNSVESDDSNEVLEGEDITPNKVEKVVVNPKITLNTQHHSNLLPKTGDTRSTMLYVALFMSSMALMVVAGKRRSH